MDSNGHHRHRPAPAGPRDLHSQMLPPRTSTSEPQGSRPEMIQTGRTSALSPKPDSHDQMVLESPRRSHQAEQAIAPAQDASSNRRQASSPYRSTSRTIDYRDRQYPHAPPPARHRSRSPAGSPPVPPPKDEGYAPEQPRKPSPSSTHRPTARSHPFQSSHVYHNHLAYDPRRLLPTPVRPPVAFTFELAPSETEFIYTPPRTSEDGEALPATAQAIMVPVPGTGQEITAENFGLICADPQAFDDSRRMPVEIEEGSKEDVAAKEEVSKGFLYETGEDYEAGRWGAQEEEEEVTEMMELPSSPPLFQQFAVFEEIRGEAQSTIRQVSEMDQADSSQLEIPGMWP